MHSLTTLLVNVAKAVVEICENSDGVRKATSMSHDVSFPRFNTLAFSIFGDEYSYNEGLDFFTTPRALRELGFDIDVLFSNPDFQFKLDTPIFHPLDLLMFEKMQRVPEPSPVDLDAHGIHHPGSGSLKLLYWLTDQFMVCYGAESKIIHRDTFERRKGVETCHLSFGVGKHNGVNKTLMHCSSICMIIHGFTAEEKYESNEEIPRDVADRLKKWPSFEEPKHVYHWNGLCPPNSPWLRAVYVTDFNGNALRGRFEIDLERFNVEKYLKCCTTAYYLSTICFPNAFQTFYMPTFWDFCKSETLPETLATSDERALKCLITLRNKNMQIRPNSICGAVNCADSILDYPI